MCVKCKRGVSVPEGDATPGATLFAALAQAVDAPGDDLSVEMDAGSGLRMRAVECLSNCDRGCSIALRGAGRWTFVYGDLDDTEHVAVILDGARRYAATPDGLVRWRERPEHFRKHCIARIPPLEAPHD